MAQICTGLCERLKSISVRNSLRYSTGQKRCSLCAHYFYTKNPRCPCCTTRLRVRPRSKKTRNENCKNMSQVPDNYKKGSWQIFSRLPN